MKFRINDWNLGENKMKIQAIISWFLFPALLFSQQISTNKDSLKIYDSDTLLVFNTGDSNLVLDTLYSVKPQYGYWLKISTKDTIFEYYSVSNVIDPTPLNLIIQPNNTAKFIFYLVDLCIFCKTNNTSEYFTDTLVLISNSIENDTLSLIVEGEGMLSSVDEEKFLYKLELKQNYPNPFNPTTTISFTIPLSQMVELKVYDMLGQEVAELVNEYVQGGSHSVQFNASHISSGIYFYKLKVGNFVQTKKLILLK